MATRRQPLIPGWLIPGLCAAALMITVSLAAFLALWLNAPSVRWSTIWRDSYLWRNDCASHSGRRFCPQCCLWSRRFSRPRALYRRRFSGRLALLRLCAMTLVCRYWLPCSVFLACMAVRGWLASLWRDAGAFSGLGYSPRLAGAFTGARLLTCQWRAVCCAIFGKHSRRAAPMLPSSAMRGWHFPFLSNGRGCAAKFHPSRR